VSPLVRYADAEPNGLADLLGRLLEANVEQDPARRRLLAPAVIEVDATDAEVAERTCRRARRRTDPSGRR
jgi:hypothetical protein